MSPFAIFAVVLTIAYIIYYGYNISKDLYGKKGSTDATVEEFDLGSVEDAVVATPVRESADGFSLGGQEVEPVALPEDEATPAKPNRIREKIDNQLSKMDEADVSLEGAVKPVELEDMLVQDFNRQNFAMTSPKPKMSVHRDAF